MKVLYDNFIFQNQTIGGISRCCHELMKSMYDEKILDFYFPIYYSLNRYIQNAQYTPKMNFYMNSFLCKIGEFRKYLRRKNTTSVIKALKTGKYDIFHPTYFSDYFIETLDAQAKTKLVITIHDMVTEAYSEIFKDDPLKIPQIKRLLAHRADKIITISEFSKSEILKYYPDIKESKIQVIYHGSPLENVVYEEKNKDNFILHVGTRSFYKNFNKMLIAIAPILKDKNIKLVCASNWDFDEIEQNLISKLDINDYVISKKPSDKELFELYAKAKCCVFPSLYEGFGMPIIEAFASNCPVVCANNASLPEVGSDACVYFDGNDEKSIYEAVKTVLENDSLQKDMIEKGLHRLKDFNWHKTALQHKKVYEELINNG